MYFYFVSLEEGGGGKKISMFGGPDRARWRTELSSVENTAQFSK